MPEVEVELTVKAVDWEEIARSFPPWQPFMALLEEQRQAVQAVEQARHSMAMLAGALSTLPAIQEAAMARARLEEELIRTRILEELGANVVQARRAAAGRAWQVLRSWRRWRPGNIMRLKLQKMKAGRA